MLRHFPISGVEVRLIAAGAGNGGQKVIRDEDLRGALKELKGMDVRLNPGREVLREAGFGEGVIAGP